MSETVRQCRIRGDTRAPVRRAMTPFDDREGLVFQGTPTPWAGTYGGDLMVHCSSAARHGRQLGHLVSASVEFLCAADPHEDVTASSEIIRAGRSITHIRVILEQSGEEKVAAMLVYETEPARATAPAELTVVQDMPRTMPNGIPPISEAELAELPEDFRDYYANTRGLDVRYITKPPFVESGPAGGAGKPGAESRNWTRVLEPPDSGAEFSDAVLFYVADDSALEPVLNVEGISWSNDDASIVTLSHSMRFTGLVEPGDWLYCANRLYAVFGRYVETTGTITTYSGRLVATTRQLGIKVRPV